MPLRIIVRGRVLEGNVPPAWAGFVREVNSAAQSFGPVTRVQLAEAPVVPLVAYSFEQTTILNEDAAFSVLATLTLG